MLSKTIAAVAVAALGLAAGAYSASAGPAAGGAALSTAKAPSTFTLVRGGGGPGGGGGHVGGAGFSGGHFGGGHMGGSFGGHPGGSIRGGGNPAAIRGGGTSFAASGRFSGGPGVGGVYRSGPTALHRPGIAARGFDGGRHFHGRPAFYHGRRGYWRHGHFYPFFGVGLWGYDYGYGGGCYANCLAAGYGPRYCSIYSANFCY